MPYTKPVIREPYYDCPVWIESDVTRNEVTFLSSESSVHDVELFLLHLFGYNSIDVSHTIERSFEELFALEEVAILGGVAFLKDEDTVILPSCCCGLEDWETINESIERRQSPWLGHDPSPGIAYHDDYLTVWSDDSQIENNEVLNIRFTYPEMKESLDRTRRDILGFIEKPLYQWLEVRDKEIAINMKEKMHTWFLKEKR
ncbi:hypothetical protein [Paenibacillus sp. NEAU-GSW1]|uniref:hypothetical protein n=1 Tax=Paenibacillus sp. NEAU-GSW1 TaxID=2682486 RepID=UPI0012E2FCB2|nr:hypothetical protein [Paenibacillus sp. NEAU-GSW1]MUT65181.1 hypothetical protein [Paenibacillus sp. NEAU-GSW1]